MASPTLNNLSGLAGRTADLSGPDSAWGPLPYAVVQIIKHYGGLLDRHAFPAMRLAGDTNEKRDLRTGRNCNTDFGAWIKRWWPCGERRATDSHFHHQDIDTLFVRSFEGIGYERCIGNILGHMWASILPK